jgi:hypothetical protein
VAAEDDVDGDVVEEAFEQPIGIGLFGDEATLGQGRQGSAGVLGPNEHVDVVRPTGAAVDG